MRPSRGSISHVLIRFVPVLAAMIVAALATALLPSFAAEPQDASTSTRGRAPDEAPGPEIAERRTRTSRTYEGPGGTEVTRLWTTPVNYRDAAGEWQRIDNSLVPSNDAGFAYENRDNKYEVKLPSGLDEGPVRIDEDGRWMSFELVGGAGDASVSANRARYAAALPGVTAEYFADGDSVKEALVLESSDAARVFRFRVQASEGLTAHENSEGEVEFRDSEDRVAFAFAAPFMTDSSSTTAGGNGRVAMDIARDGNGWTLTLDPDREWLQGADREFPVTIDPTVLTGAAQDCHIRSGSRADENFCARDGIDVGYDSPTTWKHRGLLKWDVTSAIPQDRLVTSARIGLFQFERYSSTSVDVAVHEVTRGATRRRSRTTPIIA